MSRLIGLMVLVVVASGATLISADEQKIITCGGTPFWVGEDETCKTAMEKIELWLLGERENQYKGLIYTRKEALEVLAANGHERAKEFYDYMNNCSVDLNERYNDFRQLLTTTPFRENPRSYLSDECRGKILYQFKEDCINLPKVEDFLSKVKNIEQELNPEAREAWQELHKSAMEEGALKYVREYYSRTRRGEKSKRDNLIESACRFVNQMHRMLGGIDVKYFYELNAGEWAEYIDFCKALSEPEKILGVHAPNNFSSVEASASQKKATAKKEAQKKAFILTALAMGRRKRSPSNFYRTNKRV